ncbi:Imm6 family immunity protein [Clostridium felsineum]|uniref:Imm6 family immunity protein n=1 Tax=Clostridium felsineum TaxID=36839 RepID=UPI0009CEA5D5|nr:Imm6 family immunity protein [Clostridium felsineum]URZ02152.1 hypothetical protein CLAUR_021490 [Clostridium felsineum]
MIIKLDGICENGKVAVALIMSEITLDSIEQLNTEYKFCRDAIDMCWEWLEGGNVNKYEICSLIANDNKCLADITNNTEDDKLGNKYGTIMISVSYVAWQAYNKENNYHYPQYLEVVDDEYLVELIKELIEIDKLITEENIKFILNNLREKYPDNVNDKFCIISKDQILDNIVKRMK